MNCIFSMLHVACAVNPSDICTLVLLKGVDFLFCGYGLCIGQITEIWGGLITL